MLIIIPAPSAQRAPHAYRRRTKGAGWLKAYEGDHRVGVMHAIRTDTAREVRAATTGPFVRPGGWSTFRVDVDDEAAAVDAWRTYWLRHFWTPFPPDEEVGARKVSSGAAGFFAMLAAFTGDPVVEALALGAGVAEDLTAKIIDTTKAGESVVAAVSPEAREILAQVVEAVELDIETAEDEPTAARGLAAHAVPDSPALAARVRGLG